MPPKNTAFRRSIAPALESIDSILSSQSKPLLLRPLDAASLLTRHFIAHVEGEDDKDNFLEKPWFAAIYAEVHRWYERKYGPLTGDYAKTLTGLIVHAGLPHTIQIPRTISARQDDGLLKLTFPTKLYPGENPAAWVKPKIRVSRLRANARKKIERRIGLTCDAMRQIAINTGSAGGKNTKVPLMAWSVIEHLSKAASSASVSHKESNSLALWDVHLACEKAMKSLLAQRSITFPNTHDLNKLNVLIDDRRLQRDAGRVIRRLPSSNLVIRHRYLEEKPISPDHLYYVYRLAVKLCVRYTSELTHEMRIGDASFFLKQPPWFSQLD